MSFFRLENKEGEKEAYTTSFPSVGVVFPFSHNVSFGSCLEIAQLIHVPESCPTFVVKVPLTASPNINIPEVSWSFPYRVVYNLSPPDQPPRYEQINDVYVYKSSVSLNLDYIDIEAFLRTYNNTKSSSYGLAGSNKYFSKLRVYTPVSSTSQSGDLVYSIFEFKTNGIPTGWYWFVLKPTVRVVGNNIPSSSVKNIALTVNQKIFNVASSKIAELRQQGKTIYNWQLHFYDTDDRINFVDGFIRSKLIEAIESSSSIFVKPSFYDGYAPQGLGGETYNIGGIPFYFVRRADIGAHTGFVPFSFAVKTGQSWQFPENDMYMITKVEKGAEQDEDFETYVRFSLVGDLSNSSVWTNWEKFTNETGWQPKGIRELSLTDSAIGGSSLPGTRIVYVNFMRKVAGLAGTISQYALAKASIYYTGQPPIITSVRIGYFLEP